MVDLAIWIASQCVELMAGWLAFWGVMSLVAGVLLLAGETLRVLATGFAYAVAFAASAIWSVGEILADLVAKRPGKL